MLNAFGIVFEIAGFVLVVVSVRSIPPSKPGKTVGFLNVMNRKRVMGELDPVLNRMGIAIVIMGLGLQLLALSIPKQ